MLPVTALTTGTCYGFAVHSSLPFAYLRSGTGQRLEIIQSGHEDAAPGGEPLLSWGPPQFPVHVRLHDVGHGCYRLWVANAGWFFIDAIRRRVEVPASPSPVRLEERIWGMPALLCFLHRGDLPLHAAAVEIHGRAILIAAPGRYGKTTLLTALARAGHRVLNEDLACLRMTSNGPVLVPGPAMLRIRRDVPEELFPPQFTEVGRDDDRVHLACDLASRRDCTPVPVASVILLRSADADPVIETVSPDAAIADLWALSFNLPRDEDRARCFRGVADLAGSIPLWDLHRRVRFDDLPATVQTVLEIAGA